MIQGRERGLKMEPVVVGYEDHGLPDARAKFGAFARESLGDAGLSRDSVNHALGNVLPSLHTISMIVKFALILGLGAIAAALYRSNVLPEDMRFTVLIVFGVLAFAIIPFVSRVIRWVGGSIGRFTPVREPEFSDGYAAEGVYTLDERDLANPKPRSRKFSERISSAYDRLGDNAGEVFRVPNIAGSSYGRSLDGKGLWLDSEGLTLVVARGERETFPWHKVRLSETRHRWQEGTGLAVHLPDVTLQYFGLYLDRTPSEIIEAAERFRSAR